MKARIIKIIIQSLKEFSEDFDKAGLRSPNAKTRLYGGKGCLDSLAMVALLADIEERIAQKFRRPVVLVSEKAFSQRLSPFRDVQNLAEYICRLLDNSK